MNRKYTINVYVKYNFDGTREWVAEYPDISGLVGVGNTKMKAIYMAENAKNVYLDHLEKEGISFPEKKFLEKRELQV